VTAKKKEQPEPAVLIDTSVWEEYFRREETIFRRVNELMDAGRVCSLDLIMAELMEGAATEEERKAFQDFARIFPILREPAGVWTQAAEWARNLRFKKTNLSLRYSYVAFMAKTHGALLWTRSPILSSLRKAAAPGLKFFSEEGESQS
jgi:predicted nucleic acid-binding protein